MTAAEESLEETLAILSEPELVAAVREAVTGESGAAFDIHRRG